jgi:hypothetical protein
MQPTEILFYLSVSFLLGCFVGGITVINNYERKIK